MNLNEVFPSTYLKKEHLPGNRDLILTIDSCTKENVGQGQDAEVRPVLWFKEDERGLVLNKTNVGRLYAAYNTVETDDLQGKKVSLYVDHEVGFGGKTVGGIRIRATAPEEESPPF